jgi:hypothetical protein
MKKLQEEYKFRTPSKELTSVFSRGSSWTVGHGRSRDFTDSPLARKVQNFNLALYLTKYRPKKYRTSALTPHWLKKYRISALSYC